MDKTITILFTCCQAQYCDGIFQSIRNNEDGKKFRIIGTDMNEAKFNYHNLDAIYKVPASKSEEYLQAILDVCDKEKVDIVIPMYTHEINEFYENRHLFAEKGILIKVSNGEGLTVANDKAKMTMFLAENGLNAPKHFVCMTAITLLINMMENENIDFIAKVPNECSSNGIYHIGSFKNMIMSQSEIEDMFKDKNAMYLIEEYLPNKEYAVDMLFDHGKCLCGVVREQVDIKNSIPSYAVVVKKDDVYEQCRLLGEKLKLDGNIGFDLKCDNNDVPYIIDVNPRYSATTSLATAAGINLAYLGIKHLLGEPIDKQQEPIIGTAIKRITKSLFYDADGKEVAV